MKWDREPEYFLISGGLSPSLHRRVSSQIKANRRIDRFKRRGRAAARSEWRLIAATHNLLKLRRHTLAAVAA